jgi:hypothetical protein
LISTVPGFGTIAGQLAPLADGCAVLARAYELVEQKDWNHNEPTISKYP